MENYKNGQKLVAVCSNCSSNFIYTFGDSDSFKCYNCGRLTDLYPLDIQVILAPTLEQAKTVDADISIEAEYGSETITGKKYTSAHHGVNCNNPAPCMDKNIPYMQDGIVVVSHIDLDMIIGCMRVFGLLSEDENDKLNVICNAIEYIDVHGPHHINKYPQQTKDFFNAYWAWNESRGRQEKITETTNVTQKVLQAIEVIQKIVLELDCRADNNNGIDYIKLGRDWAKNVQEATENCLYEETTLYRVFLTDRVFCGASYWSPKQKQVVPSIVSYNEKYKAITLSFADSGEKYNAISIMQKLFGDQAGGKPGIAGTPRGQEYEFKNTQIVLEELEKLEEESKAKELEELEAKKLEEEEELEVKEMADIFLENLDLIKEIQTESNLLKDNLIELIEQKNICFAYIPGTEGYNKHICWYNNNLIEIEDTYGEDMHKVFFNRQFVCLLNKEEFKKIIKRGEN